MLKDLSTKKDVCDTVYRKEPVANVGEHLREHVQYFETMWYPFIVHVHDVAMLLRSILTTEALLLTLLNMESSEGRKSVASRNVVGVPVLGFFRERFCDG